MCGWVNVQDQYVPFHCIVNGCDVIAPWATESVHELNGEDWDGTAVCTDHFLDLCDGVKLVAQDGAIIEGSV